jgi:transcriptional regulator with XRE-family HTH domain
MDLGKIFVRNMKSFRKKAGLSQQRLAELCGASHSFIRQIECGSRLPSFASIARIASALNVMPAVLFLDEDETLPGVQSSLKRRQEAEDTLIENISRSVHESFAELEKTA